MSVTGQVGVYMHLANDHLCFLANLTVEGFLFLHIILFLYVLAACSSHVLVALFLLPTSDLPKFVSILLSFELQYCFFFFPDRRSFLHLAPFPFLSSSCFLISVLGGVGSVAGFSVAVLSPVPCPSFEQLVECAQKKSSPGHIVVLFV